MPSVFELLFAIGLRLGLTLGSQSADRQIVT